MQDTRSRLSAQRLTFIVFLVALLAALANLLCACGGADTDSRASAPARVDLVSAADNSAAEPVFLDLEALGSIEAAVDHAARSHGAPGEDERMRYLVRARSRADAEQLAVVLAARGFAPVFQMSETQP
jgi:hypothetical protein